MREKLFSVIFAFSLLLNSVFPVLSVSVAYAQEATGSTQASPSASPRPSPAEIPTSSPSPTLEPISTPSAEPTTSPTPTPQPETTPSPSPTGNTGQHLSPASSFPSQTVTGACMTTTYNGGNLTLGICPPLK